MTAPAIGQAVPEFTALATSGKTVALADLKGKTVVIYFYPKDSTPGCTQEGQDFRDLYPEFVKLNAEIFGVSRDSLKSHENFKCKQRQTKWLPPRGITLVKFPARPQQPLGEIGRAHV